MKLVLLKWRNLNARKKYSYETKYWDDMLHPEDKEIAEKSNYKSHFFELVDTEGKYFTIKQKSISFRVLKEACISFKYEGLYLGDKVRFIDDSFPIIDLRDNITYGYIDNLVYDKRINRINYCIKNDVMYFGKFLIYQLTKIEN